MASPAHLVARQTIEIEGSDRLQCEALAARTGQASPLLATAVERGLDSLGTLEGRIRLDRVELDLGAIEPMHWEDGLAGAIRDRLPNAIVEAVRRREADHVDPVSAAILILQEFARSGRLPWWRAPSDSPRDAVLVLRAGSCPSDRIRSVLMAPGAAERLANQLDDDSLLTLVGLASPGLELDPPALFAALSELAAKILPLETSRAGVPALVWQAAIAEAASDFGSRSTAGSGIGEFEQAVADRLAAISPAARARFENMDQDRPAFFARAGVEEARVTVRPERLAAAVKARLAAAGIGGDARGAAMSARIARTLDGLGGRRLEQAEEALASDPGRAGLAALIAALVRLGLAGAAEAGEWTGLLASPRPGASDSEHDCIAVSTSGLVIASPFLAELFDRLDMIADGNLKGTLERHRAAALLHYLATGERSPPEEDLPLAKLLAGLELDLVHEPGEPLSDREGEAADELLDALLGHAPMLGKLSRAGLREAFLLRPGSLTTRDGHWLLRAERRSFDVLLDRLPWSFSWVSLPWMAGPLRVEW